MSYAFLLPRVQSSSYSPSEHLKDLYQYGSQKVDPGQTVWGFIRYFILEELAKDVDGYAFSNYVTQRLKVESPWKQFLWRGTLLWPEIRGVFDVLGIGNDILATWYWPTLLRSPSRARPSKVKIKNGVLFHAAPWDFDLAFNFACMPRFHQCAHWGGWNWCETWHKRDRWTRTSIGYRLLSRAVGVDSVENLRRFMIDV